MPSSNRLAVRALILTSMLTLVAACSDDTQAPDPTDTDTLLAIEIDDYVIHAFAEEGLAFASDTDGAVLAVASWSGPSTVTLTAEPPIPETVSVTLVRQDLGSLVLATELGVPTGGVMRFDGAYAHNPTGEGTITFTNAPACESYRITSSLASRSGTGPFPTTHDVTVHWDAVDVFLRIDPPGGRPLGAWQVGVRDGDDLVLDLGVAGTLTPLTRHAVPMPDSGGRLTANVYRHLRSGFAENYVSFHFENFHDALPDSVVFYTPQLDPADLECFFQVITDDEPAAYDQQTTRGVPPAFSALAGDLVIGAADVDVTTFTMTSAWDRFVARWQRSGDGHSRWSVEGRPPIVEFALPELPQVVVDLDPGFAREQFILHIFEVERESEEGVRRAKGLVFPFPDQPTDVAVEAPRPTLSWK